MQVKIGGFAAFCIAAVVAFTISEIVETIVNRTKPEPIPGPKGDKGDTGDSLYDLAVKNGFKGTVEEWLAGLNWSTTEPPKASE